MSSTQRFAAAMREHQLRWALNGNIPSSALQIRNGKLSWVLKNECRWRNLFERDWLKYIDGSAHLWASALNSSQCFGVNIFAPLAGNEVAARHVLTRLLPDRQIGPQDSVKVFFEHTPEGAAERLGERGQATQVDVFFEIRNALRPIGYVLVEVKFAESDFGSCRGWNGKHRNKNEKTGIRSWTNPDRTRCEDVGKVIASPETQCWLTKAERRQYWNMMFLPSSSFRKTQFAHAGACPFRHGLYQLMRNRILADDLCRRTPGTWADFVVCRHPSNNDLATLKDSVLDNHDAFAAFHSLSSPSAVKDCNAAKVVDLIATADGRHPGWRSWMERRYFPSETALQGI